MTYPEVVEGRVGDSLPGDVLGQLVDDCRVLALGVQGEDRAWDQLSMAPHR